MKRHLLSIIIKAILILFILIISLAYLIPIKSNIITHIILSPIENKFRKKIEFNDPYIWIPGRIYLRDASIIDKGGRLYYCKTFNIRYNLIGLLSIKKEFSFNLSDIKLYQNVGLLDSVANMLVISIMPDVEFEEIKGVLQLRKDVVYIKDVYAYNEKMRIRGSGWINKDGLLNCDVNFSFSKDVTDMVPDAVKAVILKREGGGWMGIALKVGGNYKKPSLHITSETLKLNIIEGLFRND